MRLRAYRDSDLSQLVILQNEADADLYEFIPCNEGDIRVRLTGASAVTVATDPEDRIIGVAHLHSEWYGEAVTLCGLPGPRQEDIENLLLSTIERESQTGTISASIDTLQSQRLAFFRARGYGNERSFYQLVVWLNRSRPMPKVPAGYVIRRLKPDEEEELVWLVNAAYQAKRLSPGILARWKAEDSDFTADCVQIAEHKGQLAAAVAAHTDRAFNEHYHANRAYLGPAATLPSHRGQGLIKALTGRALNLLYKRGMQAVRLHTWEGNPPALAVAKDLGFHLDHEWKILHKTLR